MRIAQLAPLAESVPPKFYGGTERVVAWLVDELVELGLGCVQTHRSGAAVAANHCSRPMSSARIVNDRAKGSTASGYCGFGRAFRPSGGADGCNQAWFADDVHHPCEVIGENMQRHLSGDIP